MTFILASSSPRRLSLLSDIGIKPDRIASADIDETPHARELPKQLAERLSYQKLQKAVSDLNEKAVVLSADTVVGCGRRILRKAETNKDVEECLRLMSGRRHHVFTGVAVRAENGTVYRALCDSVVIFKHMNDAEIASYIAGGEGIGKAGGYAIQGMAATFIRHISGSYSNIVGLPLYETSQILRKCGIGI